MSKSKGNGSNGAKPSTGQSSGIELEIDGERTPITEVINAYELHGDDVRVKLMEAIRSVVLEAREARKNAKQYSAELQLAQRA